jgi:small subunit ribosomal protein S16
MAVAIRLRREGNRNRAFYRIVVADSRARRDGRFIETIGTYNPNQQGINFQVDIARADDWITKGAQPSDTVRSLLKKARRGEGVLGSEAEAPAETPEAVPQAQPEPAKEEEAPAAEAKSEEAAPEPAPAAEAADDASEDTEEKES